jgi:tight adherence protein C
MSALPSLTDILLPLLLCGLAVVLFAMSRDTNEKRVEERLIRLRRDYAAPTGYSVLGDTHHADNDDASSSANLPQKLLKLVMAVLNRLPLASQKDRKQMVRALGCAGFGDARHVQLFFTLKLISAALFAVVAMIFPLPMISGGPLGVLNAALMGAVLGMMLPNMVISQMAKRRQAKIGAALPDALDLMTICTNAGYSLDMSVDRVAREMAVVAPAMAREFEITAGELRFLPDRQTALRNMADRNDLASMRSLVVTLIQTQKFGTPLTVALKTLSDAERKTRIMKVEERAAKLPALITLPLMLFILPTVFLIVGGPAVIQVLAIIKD